MNNPININTVEEALTAFQQLEELHSKADQDRIINSVAENPVFTSMVKHALNPYTLYRVNADNLSVKPTGDRSGMAARWGEFYGLILALSANMFELPEAERIVYRFLCDCTPDEAKWYRKVINKQLYCGSGMTRKLKFRLPGLVPVFRLPKPGPFNEKELAYPISVERIVTGRRLVGVLSNGVAHLHTADGTIFVHTYPLNLIARYVKEAVVDGWMTESCVYIITDYLTYKEFTTGDSAAYAERYTRLSNIRQKLIRDRVTSVQVTRNMVCGSRSALDLAMATSRKQGFAGVWLKKFELPYHTDREDAWMEWKHVR